MQITSIAPTQLDSPRNPTRLQNEQFQNGKARSVLLPSKQQQMDSSTAGLNE